MVTRHELKAKFVKLNVGNWGGERGLGNVKEMDLIK